MKPDHLIGAKKSFLKLSFLSVTDLMKIKKILIPIVRRNKDRKESQDIYSSHKSHFALDEYENDSRFSTNSSRPANEGNASHQAHHHFHNGKWREDELLSHLIDLREYDVPYYIRVSIDLKIFVGHWYKVKGIGGMDNIYPTITLLDTMEERPEPVILAFDIETTKPPLKFPDSSFDQIMMISYVVDTQGYLITNREIVSKDIEDFEYTPKPEFEGFFTIFNEINEVMALLKKFFDHVIALRPNIYVTYNGDNFDWPFIKARAAVNGLDLYQEIGVFEDLQKNFLSHTTIHIDCLKWVKRDSYLPVGSQGLKAVAKIKLNYSPSELDPEKMCTMAVENPQVLASYSVSDALATYYLYIKYIHSFIFSLCTIVPMGPDDVLRKGSGTLCETLLMVQAYHANIIFPNKHGSSFISSYNETDETTANAHSTADGGEDSGSTIAPVLYHGGLHGAKYKYTKDGFLLEQETYIGGHVEAIESGVFRTDISLPFKIEISYVSELIENVENIMRNAIENEEEIPITQIVNFKEVCDLIAGKLYQLSKMETLVENPKIYHLDVGAMYPNIILTNRLQPYAIVDETICAKCTFNVPGADCQRPLTWMWRGDHMPINKTETQRILLQLENETFTVKSEQQPPPSFNNTKDKTSTFYNSKQNIINRGGDRQRKPFHRLPTEQRNAIEKQRLKDYCRRAYKKVKVTKEEEKVSVTCQRENAFYIDTVRAFRDRRYDFKNLVKMCNKKMAAMKASETQLIGGESMKDLENKKDLYDSLQLAHKCILNSFYGYVMRKGARWFSMEMAGIVCLTGANIIKEARKIIEKIGRPLELDTDGIWCALPSSLPENFTFLTTDSKKSKINVSFIGALLNLMVREKFTNTQYQELDDPTRFTYTKRAENSIFFEVDGPYYAMLLPSAKEEGKKLKKRYAVFNMDKSLAELKGFEVKRRGELPFLKLFQHSVFEAALYGKTLEEVYESLANVANYWLDFLTSKGSGMTEEEIFELVAENKNMSKKLDEYGDRKSTSISTAKRLAEFLGDQMIKDKGLNCCYIISRKPEGAAPSDRAIPYVIFQADEKIKRYYLKKWLKISQFTPVQREEEEDCVREVLDRVDIRDILDWNYYIERLSSAVQKIITIPAAMQHVKNPVPRVPHPEWVHKKLLSSTDVFRQQKISDMFTIIPTNASKNTNSHPDIEVCNWPTKSKQPYQLLSDTTDKGCDSISNFDKRPSSAIDSSIPPSSNPNKRRRYLNNVGKREKYWKKMIGSAPPLRFGNKLNFEAWLTYHKSKWRIQLQNSKGSLEDIHVSTLDNAESRKSLLKSLKHVETDKMYNNPWHIIQVLPIVETPGLFQVWAIVDRSLRSIKLHVPRVFYINQYVSHGISEEIAPNDKALTNSGGVLWEKVNRTLPRGQPTYFLYKFQIPEDIYQDFAIGLEKDLTLPHIEGIYENQVPLLFRIYLELGCIWQINYKHRLSFKRSLPRGKAAFKGITVAHAHKGSTEVFNLSQLQNIDSNFDKYSGSENSCKNYLIDRSSVYNNNTFGLRYLYLYYHNATSSTVTSSQIGREFWMLCDPAANTIYVYLFTADGNVGSESHSTTADTNKIYIDSQYIGKMYEKIKEQLKTKIINSSRSQSSLDMKIHPEFSKIEINKNFQVNPNAFSSSTKSTNDKKKENSNQTLIDSFQQPSKSGKTLTMPIPQSVKMSRDAIRKSLKYLIKEFLTSGDEFKDAAPSILAYQAFPTPEPEHIDLYSDNQSIYHLGDHNATTTTTTKETSSSKNTNKKVTKYFNDFLAEIQNTIIPCIRITPNTVEDEEGETTIDNNYHNVSMPDWQKIVLKKGLGNYVNSPKILNALLGRARYLNIPIGNLCNDLPLLGADLAYGRKLQKNDCVLWATRQDKPDLGGKENDDLSVDTEEAEDLFEMTSIHQNRNNSNSDGTTNPYEQFNYGKNVVNNAGFYRNISLELKMIGLPISALLLYTRILENEGISPALNFSTRADEDGGALLGGGRSGGDQRKILTIKTTPKPGATANTTACSQNDLSNLIDNFNTKNQMPLLNGTANTSSFFDSSTLNVTLDDDINTLNDDTNPIHSLHRIRMNRPNVTLQYDEIASNSEAFKILRTVVQHWIRDIAKEDSSFADIQLLHFSRWLKCGRALLYEPAIKKAITTLTKKLFQSLIKELKKLGVRLIYADFNRLIVCTNKVKVSEAFSYIEYIFKVLRDHVLFHGLNFKINYAWDILLWLGPNNYSGIKCKIQPDDYSIEKRAELFSHQFLTELFDETAVIDTNITDAILGSEKSKKSKQPRVHMSWNIARYLPTEPNCQYFFNMIIALYIMSVSDFMQQETTLAAMGFHEISYDEYEKQFEEFPDDDDDDDKCNRNNQCNKTSQDNSVVKTTSIVNRQKPNNLGGVPLQCTSPGLLTYSQNLIETEISEKLFKIIQKVQNLESNLLARNNYRNGKSTATTSIKKSSNKGESFLRKFIEDEDSALSLTKAVCHVLGIDTNVALQVENLKRDLLKLLQIGEFSDKAEFQLPLHNLIIREVICQECFFCRDIDICNEILIDEETKELYWECNNCQSPLDKDAIETTLVKMLKDCITKFTLQDLACDKCRDVKASNFSTRCKCNGTYDFIYSTSSMITILKNFDKMAKLFKMSILAGLIAVTYKYNFH